MFIVKDYEKKDFKFENFVFPQSWQFGMYRHRFPEVSGAAVFSGGGGEDFVRPCLCICVGLFFGSPAVIGDAAIVTPAELKQSFKRSAKFHFDESDPLFLMVTIAALTRSGVKYTAEFLAQSKPLLKRRAEALGFEKVILLGEIDADHSRSLAYAKRQGFTEIGRRNNQVVVLLPL